MLADHRGAPRQVDFGRLETCENCQVSDMKFLARKRNEREVKELSVWCQLCIEFLMQKIVQLIVKKYQMKAKDERKELRGECLRRSEILYDKIEYKFE